jgi:AraC-like DNA-binding protein
MSQAKTASSGNRVYLDHPNRDLSADLLIDHVGCLATAPDEYTNTDRRVHDILHYVVSGKGSFFCKGVEYRLTAGCIYLFPRNVNVTYRADHDDPWTVFYTGFYGGKSDIFLSQLGLSADHIALYRKPDDQILSYYKGMQQEINRKNPSYTVLTGYFYLIVGSLLHDQADRDDRAVPIDLCQAISNYIDSGLDQPLRVQNIARSFHLSQSQLFRIFKQKTGLSPHQYIEAAKIEYACHLIRTGRYSIKEVAVKCGYEYESHFYKSFSHKIGMTPVQYRDGNIAEQLSKAHTVHTS